MLEKRNGEKGITSRECLIENDIPEYVCEIEPSI
jgi:hypothetical protein